VNKIPGPPAYPIVGTLLPLFLAPRGSKYDGDLYIQNYRDNYKIKLVT
jgi:hypothetical protein